MKRLGIDFGTSFIKCCDAKKEELIVLGKKLGGESIRRIPNIITYYSDGTYKFGNQNIKGKLNEASDETVLIDKIKTCLADRDWCCDIGNGKSITAADVVYDIMKSIYDIIHEKNKNENELVTTITSPVAFSENQRHIIKNAAEKAGFLVENVITEPFASLFYLMRNDMDEEHNVLILDIGGGTLDICLVTIKPHDDVCVIKTESTAGINFGGAVINNDIIDKILLPKYGKKLSEAINDPRANIANWNRFKLNYEIDEFKEAVFNEDYDLDAIDDEYDIIYDPFGFDNPVEINISVSEVYTMFEKTGIKEKITGLLDKVINDNSSLLCSEITDVFLTGGSAMIPYFKDVLLDFFKENDVDDAEKLFELNDNLDYEERAVGAVALGAGAFSVISSADEGKYIIKDKIPFRIFTRNSDNKSVTKINADCSYKNYHSLPYPVEEFQIKNGRIDVYQSLEDENNETVYIGYIPLRYDIKNKGYSYRLGVDVNRNIFSEFGTIEGNKNDADFVSQTKEYMIFCC